MSVFNLPTVIEPVGGGTNSTYRRVTANRNYDETSFSNGILQFEFGLSPHQWFIPGRSGFRMIVESGFRDPRRPFNVSDGVTYTKDIGTHLFQTAEYQLDGTTLSKIYSHMPQISALKSRMKDPSTWQSEMGRFMHVGQHGFNKRQFDTTKDWFALETLQATESYTLDSKVTLLPTATVAQESAFFTRNGTNGVYCNILKKANGQHQLFVVVAKSTLQPINVDPVINQLPPVDLTLLSKHFTAGDVIQLEGIKCRVQFPCTITTANVAALGKANQVGFAVVVDVEQTSLFTSLGNEEFVFNSNRIFPEPCTLRGALQGPLTPILFTLTNPDGTPLLAANPLVPLMFAPYTVGAADEEDYLVTGVQSPAVTIYKAPQEVQSREAYENTEFWFQLPLSIFEVTEYGLPGGRHTFLLNPNTQSQLINEVFQSKFKGYTERDLFFNIKEFYFMAYVVEGPPAMDTEFIMDLHSIRMQRVTNLSPDNSERNCEVRPSTSAIAVMFQDTRTQSDTRLSSSEFKWYKSTALSSDFALSQNPQNLALNLTDFKFEYAGKQYPMPPAVIKYQPGTDNITQMWLTSIMQQGSFYSTHPETLLEWVEQGPYFFYMTLRDGDDKSTRVTFTTQFKQGSVTESDMQNCALCVFDFAKQAIKVTIRNGRYENVVFEEL